MKFRIEVIRIDDTGAEEPQALMSFSKDDNLAMETLGLTLADSKVLLHDLQGYLIDQQATAYLEQHRACPSCGRRLMSKGQGRTPVNTMFGPVAVPNPRWYRCACQSTGPRTFRPTATWLTGQTSPELLYVETKWASLLPYAKVADLLKDVLPVAQTLRAETVRRHQQATASRLEQALGEELDNLVPGTEEDWAAQPLPDGPMTVGIDGGMVRGRQKRGWFEVIAGKSIVAFTRKEADDRPSSKRFGFVQTYDHKSRRRLWELMKSQGMQENQQVLFMSDGGESVRQLQTYLHPSSEHLLDWFHVTMRLTVMQQQTKTVKNDDAALSAEAATSLDSIKHYLWHGNVEAALECLERLSFILEVQRHGSAAVAKLMQSLTEFSTYIRKNCRFIPNFGERYRQGDTISTAFVESTINQVVSKRFVKKQQMQWTPKGVHLLLQTRTRVLNDELEEVFREWYPKFRPVAA